METWITAVLATAAGVFIGVMLAFGLLHAKMTSAQHKGLKLHMLNLAIKDLTLDLWFCCELTANRKIAETGTYARYWFDGIKELNLSALTSDAADYVRIMPLVHTLDVDNRKLDDGHFASVADNASFVQKQLLSLVPVLNAVIARDGLPVPLLPSPEEMLAQIKQSYYQNAG